MIKAIVFDLDDTLIPEYEYVKSGFHAVAEYLSNPDLYDRMIELFSDNKSDVYGRAGLTDAECADAVRVYRSHKPNIRLDEEVYNFLLKLKETGYKLGIITDGRPEGQRNKIEALGLGCIMDSIIVTDELGGTEYRKPHPRAFELMAEKLNVSFDEMIYVGDNTKKDFYVSSLLPIKTVRLKNGNSSIYAEESYYRDIKENFSINSLSELSQVLKSL